MSPKSSSRTKPVRQQVVVHHLRRLIVEGKLVPGDRLPTHDAIERKFHTTHMTVQRAFDQLAADGFIRTTPKIGRFVAARPPHLTRYGLVFANSPGNGSFPQWGRYEDAIVAASRTIAAQEGISFALYHDVNGHPDSEGYQSLMRDIDAHRLAGLAFAFAPFVLESTPLLERRDPPRVNDEPMAGEGHAMRVIDEKRFFYRAIDFLLADGRRRFAVICKPQGEPGYPDEFEAAAASRGAITQPFWTQAVDPFHTKWVRHAVNAILSTPAAEPPDALIITDDHLVEPVAAALAEFGVRVPEDIRVVAHWNFPLTYRGKVPIDLLGFDSVELVREWINTIDAQRRGEKVKRLICYDARFSWELPKLKDHKYAAGEPAERRSISTKTVL